MALVPPVVCSCTVPALRRHGPAADSAPANVTRPVLEPVSVSVPGDAVVRPLPTENVPTVVIVTCVGFVPVKRHALPVAAARTNWWWSQASTPTGGMW